MENLCKVASSKEKPLGCVVSVSTRIENAVTQKMTQRDLARIATEICVPTRPDNN
jgi:hypothetical protein